jgi:hypothetical protein
VNRVEKLFRLMKRICQGPLALSGNDAPENWFGAGEPRQGADDDILNPYGIQLYAPHRRTIALPDEDASGKLSEGLLYSGPNLGGWLTGTVDGVPETMKLSPLKVTLPLPFLSEDDLDVTFAARFDEQETASHSTKSLGELKEWGHVRD